MWLNSLCTLRDSPIAATDTKLGQGKDVWLRHPAARSVAGGECFDWPRVIFIGLCSSSALSQLGCLRRLYQEGWTALVSQQLDESEVSILI